MPCVPVHTVDDAPAESQGYVEDATWKTAVEEWVHGVPAVRPVPARSQVRGNT
jgi:hypothetical protein